MDNIAVLKSVPLFSGLSDPEVAAICAIMEEKHFAPGQVIIREGEPGDYFHVILRGNVEYVSSDAEGKELILDTATAGGFFGELSMLTGAPRAIRVRAKDAVGTLALDQTAFF